MSSLQDKTVKELKDILRSLNLKVSGNKSVLIARLNEYGYSLPYTTKTPSKKALRYVKSPKALTKVTSPKLPTSPKKLPTSPKKLPTSPKKLPTSPVRLENNSKEIIVTALKQANLDLEDIIDILEEVYGFDKLLYDFTDFLNNEGFRKPKSGKLVEIEEQFDLRRIPTTKEGLNKLKVAQLRIALVSLGESMNKIITKPKPYLVDRILELQRIYAEESDSEEFEEYFQ